MHDMVSGSLCGIKSVMAIKFGLVYLFVNPVLNGGRAQSDQSYIKYDLLKYFIIFLIKKFPENLHSLGLILMIPVLSFFLQFFIILCCLICKKESCKQKYYIGETKNLF